jgi:flagellar motor component MotA
MPADPADDGHEETVEEVKARMAQLSAGMNADLKATDDRVNQMAQENASMPNFGALADVHGTIAHMGQMRKITQMK